LFAGGEGSQTAAPRYKKTWDLTGIGVRRSVPAARCTSDDDIMGLSSCKASMVAESQDEKRCSDGLSDVSQSLQKAENEDWGAIQSELGDAEGRSSSPQTTPPPSDIVKVSTFHVSPSSPGPTPAMAPASHNCPFIKSFLSNIDCTVSLTLFSSPVYSTPNTLLALLLSNFQ